MLDSPVSPPAGTCPSTWRLSVEKCKLQHVSANCRLSVDEELTLPAGAQQEAETSLKITEEVGLISTRHDPTSRTRAGRAPSSQAPCFILSGLLSHNGAMRKLRLAVCAAERAADVRSLGTAFRTIARSRSSSLPAPSQDL
jgi:hypothetical protein